MRFRILLFPPLSPSTKCRYTRGSVYRCSDVTLGQNARLETNVVIGNGCKVGENTVIRNSVIGEKCLVGNNVVLGENILHTRRYTLNSSRFQHS